uniref:CCHC-type domain-containing protein n=1 Tax=Acrobeloides nanus TaxID=290746 RepID=A0A914CWZ7_9BILA
MIVVIHNQKEFVLQNYTDPYIQALLNYYATKIEILLKDFTDMASREKKMGKFAAHPDLIDKAAVILRHCLEQNESLMKLLFERMALDHKVAFQDFAIRIQTTLNTLLEDGTVKKPVEPAKKIEVEKRSSDSKPRRQSPSSSKTKEEIREEYASSDSDDDGRRAGDPTSKTPLTGEDAFSLQLKKFVEDKKNSKKGVELCFNCARLGHKPSECIYAKAPKTLLEQMRFLYKVWKDEGKPTYTDIVERYKKRRVVVQRKFDKNKVELNGRDRLTRQLRELVPDGRVRRTHLVLCKNCAHIGHLQNECRKPPAENYHVQEMRVLIDIFVKKYRLDDVIVANIRYEDLSRESSARSRDEPRRISRSTHENSPLPSASSLTSASILPPPLEPSRPQPNLVNKPTPRPQVPRNSSANFAPNLFHILNAPEKVFGISQSEPESHLPELTGKDRLSQQLKILAPNGRVSSRLLRLCEKCACVGHKKEDCTYPQAKLEEIQMMKHLINIYQEIYGQMILANDMYEASSEKANVSREGPAQLMPKNGPIELDGKDPFSVEVQKVMLREGRI